METFLVLNASEIEASVDDQERVMIDLASGRLDQDAFLKWLRQHLRPIV